MPDLVVLIVIPSHMYVVACIVLMDINCSTYFHTLKALIASWVNPNANPSTIFLVLSYYRIIAVRRGASH